MKENKSKRTQFVTPGTAIINVISAQVGGNAERVLRKIAGLNRSTGQLSANFGVWVNGVSVGTVGIAATGERRVITLKLGVKEGLYLEDALEGDSCSLRDESSEDGIYVLKVGRFARISKKQRRDKVRVEMREGRIESLAYNILGTWVLHGRDWTDRVGQLNAWPYGEDSRRYEVLKFNAVDCGVRPLSEIPKGALRTTHVGAWMGPCPEIAAEAGITTLLHEWKSGSDDGYSICHCAGSQISRDADVWPGSARWSGRDLPAGLDHGLPELAGRASSPFAFHANATKKLYPSCQLASAYLLERFGVGKLRAVFEAIVRDEPERVYRLIDEGGITHRLVSTEQGCLVFSDGTRFPLADVSENLITSFVEMARVSENPEEELPTRARLVLDVHFYTVASSIASMRNGFASLVSGRRTWGYMFGESGVAHRIRNERLFRVLAPILGVDAVTLNVYRLQETPRGERRIDQYQTS